MGAPSGMIDNVMASLTNEKLVIKENSDGTWTSGKPNSDRMSTFKLNEEWTESWGKRSTKNVCKLEGNTMIREIEIGDKKKIILKIKPKDGGVELTHICENVIATRFFSKFKKNFFSAPPQKKKKKKKKKS